MGVTIYLKHFYFAIDCNYSSLKVEIYRDSGHNWEIPANHLWDLVVLWLGLNLILCISQFN